MSFPINYFPSDNEKMNLLALLSNQNIPSKSSFPRPATPATLSNYSTAASTATISNRTQTEDPNNAEAIKITREQLETLTEGIRSLEAANKALVAENQSLKARLFQISILSSK